MEEALVGVPTLDGEVAGSPNGRPVASAETVAGAGAKAPSLGVLFVHGIGEQKRGGTLVSYADPLAEVMHRLLTHEDEAERVRVRALADLEEQKLPRVEKRERRRALAAEIPPLREPVLLTDTHLEAGDGASGATTTLTVDWDQVAPEERTAGPEAPAAAPPDAVSPTSWRLAESWWAEQFSPPDVRTLVSWALLVSPEVLFDHYAKFLRRAWRSRAERPWAALWRLLLAPVLALGIILSSAALVFSLGVLLLLSLLPVPRLSAAVKSVGTRLATSIGDSYVLSESAVRYSAMVSRVQEDIAALCAAAERVVIVAHSQGAMIVHECLRRSVPEKVRLLVTVGSGLGKLSDLRMDRVRPRARTWQKAVTALYSLSVGACLIWWLAAQSLMSLLGTLYMGLLVIALLFVRAVGGARDEERRHQYLRLDAPGLRWVDVYASSDPVPNGPLFEAPPTWLGRSWPVWNNASVVTDHSSYRRNLDGFVLPLIVELGRCEDGLLGRRLAREADRARMSSSRRAWRTHCLVAARTAVLIPVLAAIVVNWPVLERRAGDVVDATPDWVRAVVGFVAEGLAKVLGPVHLSATTTVGVLIAAALLALAYLALAGLWRLWAERDLRRILSDESPDAGGPVAVAAAVFVAVLMTSAILAALRPGTEFFAPLGVAYGVWIFAWVGSGACLFIVFTLVDKVTRGDSTRIFLRLLVVCAVVDFAAAWLTATLTDLYRHGLSALGALVLGGVLVGGVLAAFHKGIDRTWSRARETIIAASLRAGS